MLDELSKELFQPPEINNVAELNSYSILFTRHTNKSINEKIQKKLFATHKYLQNKFAYYAEGVPNEDELRAYPEGDVKNIVKGYRDLTLQLSDTQDNMLTVFEYMVKAELFAAHRTRVQRLTILDSFCGKYINHIGSQNEQQDALDRIYKVSQIVLIVSASIMNITPTSAAQIPHLINLTQRFVGAILRFSMFEDLFDVWDQENLEYYRNLELPGERQQGGRDKRKKRAASPKKAAVKKPAKKALKNTTDTKGKKNELKKKKRK